MRRRNLLELGPRLLALDEGETARLTSAAGCTLDGDQIRALTELTEGWAVGIYLASLALSRGQADTAVVAGVSGDDHHIADYLRSEFERGLDEADLTFLTRSVVLERITPPIAEAVTGQPSAADRLQRLAHDYGLIQQVGTSGATYRYHNLLRDFLTSELDRREPGAAPELHRRAATWYQAAGETDLAIEHSLAAGDADGMARYFVAAALPAHYRGRLATLDRWMGAFDTADLARYPPLAVTAAWVEVLGGRPDSADRLADIADRSTFAGMPADGSASFESQRAMLRAIMARNGPRDVLENARLAVSAEHGGSPWNPIAMLMLGSAQFLLGDLEAADTSFGQAAVGGTARGPATRMHALARQAGIRIRWGDWDAAVELDQSAQEVLLEWNYHDIVSALIVYAVAARVAIHRGDLERGRELLVMAQLVRPLASHATPWFSVDALLELARAYLAISDPAGAQIALREAEQILRRRPALGVLTDELIEVRRVLAGASATLAGSSTLTTAELRVLPLLPTHLSFHEIAERLMISRNTVKTHAMSIYGKLWASSRSEAVSRAVELGLLDEYPAIARARDIDPPIEPGAAHRDGSS